MEPKLDPSVLSGQPIDPEMFRRVWNRVMPDQKDSPIVLSPPEKPAQPNQQARRPAPPPKPPAQKPSAPPPPAQAQQPSDPQLLRTMMGQMRAAAMQAQALSRRTNGIGRGLTRLAADRQRALRQLSTAHFLAAGQRFQPSGAVPPPPSDLALALREQFLWEQRWTRDCLSAAQQVQDDSLRELLQEQAQDARFRARDIRTMLERM